MLFQKRMLLKSKVVAFSKTIGRDVSLVFAEKGNIFANVLSKNPLILTIRSGRYHLEIVLIIF